MVVQFLIFLAAAIILRHDGENAIKVFRQGRGECERARNLRRMHAEVLVVVAGRRREHETRGGGTDPTRAQCTGSRSANVCHDRLCGHGVDGTVRGAGTL